MNKLFCLITLALLTFNLSAQKKDKIVLSIGDLRVPKEEFTANYQKNNTNVLEAKDKKTPAEYLDLYVNFKLKVLEAQKLGYDTAKAFVEELKGYRQELSRPYLTDVSFNDEMVQTAYYRTKNERQASHILILASPEASPADTLKAWNKIKDIREQIIKGADFNQMALEHSEDPSAKENKGMLGYFSAFQMVYPFENMTYKTPVGQVSEIIRTRFGYHIIKVHDERPTRGEIKVAHIMKMFPQQASEETIANYKVKIDSIYQEVIKGGDFAELAKKHSDDRQSAAQGGEMNWFTSTTMVPSFAEAAFALEKDGDISPVIRTPYGWHIIRRIELRTTQPFEKMRPELESKIRQNPAISKYSDEAFDKKLRAAYQLKIDENNAEKLAALLNDSISQQNWPASAHALKDNVLFQFAKKSIKVSDYLTWLKEQNFTAEDKNSGQQVKAMLNNFINKELIAYEDSQLEKKHPDFARIIKEYHDGILLFNISKDKIWDVASTDTVRLQKYYDTTDKKYFFGERFKGWIVRAKDNETRMKVETILDQKESTLKQEITDVFNTATENNVEITEVAAEKGDDPVVDYFIWNGPKPAGFDETTTFVHGKVDKNEQKTLKDAWGLYSSDFQELVEKEWLDSLKQKYPVKVNKKVLNTIKPVE
ncbi:MAG TPA: peptidylprolyl isomerase [Prolixibacteraceae bacterium]|nr:peptidylprolyl isomerase [Prolixibacteraceae bacterium]